MDHSAVDHQRRHDDQAAVHATAVMDDSVVVYEEVVPQVIHAESSGIDASCLS